MQSGKYYPYRTTLDKLTDHASSVQDDGDEIISFHHVGGRDWVIICRRGSTAEERAEEMRAELDRLNRPRLARGGVVHTSSRSGSVS